jgi:hypothetical protein
MIAVMAAASALSAPTMAAVYHQAGRSVEMGADRRDGCVPAPRARSRLADVGRIAQRPGIPFAPDVFRAPNLPPLKARKKPGAACMG